MPSYELDALYEALRLDEKIKEGELSLGYARSTSYGGSIDRVINSAGCQIATIHRLYDAARQVERVYPESIVIGDVLIWRLGHQSPAIEEAGVKTATLSRKSPARGES